MPKLLANLFLVSKLVSNRLNIQVNINECIVKSCDGEAIVIASCKDNLYKIDFIMVYEVHEANLM